MNKTLLKKFAAVFVVMAMILMNISFVSAADKVNGFPLPTTKTYLVTVLASYYPSGSHDSYLYTYGPLKGQPLEENIVTMDIAADAYTPIYAVADGTIYTNKYAGGSGNYLVIAHYDGTYSYYGHMMNQSSYTVGSSVNAGDIIGYVGKTGTATGYHLHFEWSWHDVYCEFAKLGYVATCPNSAASVYPHKHAGSSSNNYSVSHASSYKAYIKGTDGSLAINSAPSAQNMIGEIPENAEVTVDPSKNSGNWYWVTYNGVSGYSYSKYLNPNPQPAPQPQPQPQPQPSGNTWTGVIRGTDGNLAINSSPNAYSQVGVIPEGASCTVYPDKTSGNWYWIEYNGVSGYSYKSYIIQGSTGGTTNTRTGVIHGTDGNLAINSAPNAYSQVGVIPEGASCTVYPDRTSGNWYWVEYNGVSGYSYKAYIALQ